MLEGVCEDVCVAAIKVAGSKDQEFWFGFAALRDEYVLLRTRVPMSAVGLCTLPQQPLNCPVSALVHVSLIAAH